MGDTNYFSGTVKILTNPLQHLVKEKSLITLVWVEINQFRQNKHILLIFWGNLGSEVKQFYKTNDYILVEGYSSLKIIKSKLNQIIVTGLKVYPLVLDSNTILKEN